MRFIKIILLVNCLIILSLQSLAQTKPVKPKPNVVSKIKLPKLFTSLDIRTDTILYVSVDEAIHLINQSLKITDAKKSAYTVSSFQCVYKRVAVTENEETGKVNPTTSIVAQVFKTPSISDLWKKIIAQQLRPGEEIFFIDIVVKDTQNHLFFAPSLKLIIK